MARFISTIHWLQGTFNFDSKLEIEKLVNTLTQCCEDEFGQEGPITRGTKFRESFRSTRKIILAVNYPSFDIRGYGWISIPGAAFDAIDFDGVKALFEVLSCLNNWGTTRIDCALDDLQKKITPRIVYKEALAGNFSGFRNDSVFDEREQIWRSPNYKITVSPYTSESGTSWEALNIDFGARGSNKSWHCYDKLAESDGHRDCTRMEIRYRDEASNKIFKELLTYLNCQQVFYNQVGQIVAGGICFLDRSNDEKHLNRLQVLDFW